MRNQYKVLSERYERVQEAILTPDNLYQFWMDAFKPIINSIKFLAQSAARGGEIIQDPMNRNIFKFKILDLQNNIITVEYDRKWEGRTGSTNPREFRPPSQYPRDELFAFLTSLSQKRFNNNDYDDYEYSKAFRALYVMLNTDSYLDECNKKSRAIFQNNLVDIRIFSDRIRGGDRNAERLPGRSLGGLSLRLSKAELQAYRRRHKLSSRDEWRKNEINDLIYDQITIDPHLFEALLFQYTYNKLPPNYARQIEYKISEILYHELIHHYQSINPAAHHAKAQKKSDPDYFTKYPDVPVEVMTWAYSIAHILLIITRGNTNKAIQALQSLSGSQDTQMQKIYAVINRFSSERRKKVIKYITDYIDYLGEKYPKYYNAQSV